MVIYNNEFKTKGNKFYNKDKIESQQVYYKDWSTKTQL